MDECAFFGDEDYAVSDKGIYEAVNPRILPGGQLILASTPWGEAGLLYEKFKAGTNDLTLVAHAPTHLLHDSDLTRTIIADGRATDPENARREFDAQFMTMGSGQYFDGNAIRSSVRDDDVRRDVRYRYAVGVDLGFKSDSSAVVVVQFDGELYRVGCVRELRPVEGAPLVPSEVVATVASIAKEFGCTYVISDGHYREAVAEYLRKEDLGLVDAPAGQTGKIESYARARAMLHEGRCILPDHPRLLSQLRSVVAKPTAGGGLTITSPRKPGGGHGDLVSAWVLAMWHLSHAIVQPEKERAPMFGTPEYEYWLAVKSEREMLEFDERKYGRKGRDDW